MRSFASLAASCLALVSYALAQTSNSSSNSSATYTNPILNSVGADPWVIRHGDYYYLTSTTNDNITMRRSSVLTDWNNADVKLVFNPPKGYGYSTGMVTH